ncbi:lasso peptide biosynthesis B2 protein [Blastomonas sp. AAP53]|uniref:lasso peptide biosynthesis B2 protein n=1 Tax=Blastomonas sp. AAP53 TaxID=1248760 RepID=UPI0002E98DDF|nr:lasso peptide biosynthesis B2 protein [Blastomonas sp. AAP53]
MTFRLSRKVATFLALPRFQKLWLAPTWLALGIARLAVLLVPFRHLGRFVGVPAGVNAWVPLATEAQCRRADAIGQVIRLAASYTPFDANCFTQALAARALLGLYRIPYALFFGVARDQLAAGLKAHAWVATGPVKVTGNESFSTFTVVGMYVPQGLTR